ncbi:hypothetical protein A2V80_03510 [Candidatus Woesebacteria bacterium RBG_16_39_8b]|uniref:Uncharacterized protein n=1 Tax=Candidatus Woesebacteria bacterium RBG_16_39_8b TaxID=1802482 RepID=A0A1F7XDP5_9BACT|nr:MAG: hypothetical protein A2V80_03510 [Candidatus Woesebacteria bacterium RBG_16_39_8b]
MPLFDSTEALRQAKEALQEAINQKKLTADLLKNLGPAVIDALRPTLEALSQNTKLSKEELLQAISQIKIDVPKADVPQAQVEVRIPEIKVPEPKVTVNISDIKVPEIPPIKIPPIKVPKPEVTVNVAPAKIPKLEWPEDKMPIEGWVRLMGYDYKNPVPVQLWDGKGNPVTLFENLTQLISSGGGAAKIVKVSGFGASAFAEITNPDGRVKVELPTGSSGLTDTELRASSIDVQQASGASWSVSVNDAFRTTVASALINSDNRLRVSVETGGSGLTDAELRAAHLDVLQLSGSIDSVYVTDFGASVAASIIDSTGVQYSGSNPLPVTGTVSISGALTSAVAVGPTAADVADDGNAPIQIGGVARQANPTAVAANDVVKATFDVLGRQLIRPVQVRDLIATAYVSLATGAAFGTETTLLTAVVGSMFDLIYVMGSNDSDAAVTCDIRGVTAGNVLLSLRIPANGTAGVSLPVPLPQTTSDTGNVWTVDLDDVTGTNVKISELFSREV